MSKKKKKIGMYIIPKKRLTYSTVINIQNIFLWSNIIPGLKKTVMCARDGSEDEGLTQPGTQVGSLES